MPEPVDSPAPMKNVIVFLHRRCTVGCDHCSARATPEASKAWSADPMPRLFKILQKADVDPFVIWTGGEPFLTESLLAAGVTAAGNSGFRSEILTSGGIRPTRHRLDQLGSVPGTRLRISLDHQHQRVIPLESVVHLARAAAESGIEVCFTLRDIPGYPPASALISYLRSRLPDWFARPGNGRFIHHIPHVPLDEKPPGARVKPGSPFPDLPCRNGFRDLVVGEDGNVYPCCGAVTFRDRDLLSPGNILGQPGQPSLTASARMPLNELLRTRGPSGLARVLGVHPHALCSAPLLHPCRLCYALFHHYGNRIRKIFSKKP